VRGLSLGLESEEEKKKKKKRRRRREEKIDPIEMRLEPLKQRRSNSIFASAAVSHKT